MKKKEKEVEVEEEEDDDEQEEQEKEEVRMMTETHGHEFFSKLTPMVLIKNALSFIPKKFNFACPSANHMECINSSLLWTNTKVHKKLLGNKQSVNNEAPCYKLNNPSTLQV